MITQSRTLCIYALIDPRSNDIKYIGVTSDPRQRLKSHLSEVGNIRKRRWIRELANEGLKPSMKIIEVVQSTEIQREVYWIKVLREHGCDLFNAAHNQDTFEFVPEGFASPWAQASRFHVGKVWRAHNP